MFQAGTKRAQRRMRAAANRGRQCTCALCDTRAHRAILRRKRGAIVDLAEAEGRADDPRVAIDREIDDEIECSDDWPRWLT